MKYVMKTLSLIYSEEAKKTSTIFLALYPIIESGVGRPK